MEGVSSLGGDGVCFSGRATPGPPLPLRPQARKPLGERRWKSRPTPRNEKKRGPHIDDQKTGRPKASLPKTLFLELACPFSGPRFDDRVSRHILPSGGVFL